MNESEFTDNALQIRSRAYQLAKEGSHTEVEPLHYLAAMMPTEKKNSTIYLKVLIQKAQYEWAEFEGIVNRELVRLPSQTPAPEVIFLSHAADSVFENCKTIKDQQEGSYVTQDHILLALMEDSSIKKIFEDSQIDIETIKTQANELRGDQETKSKQNKSLSHEFLDKYCEDLTEKAREGKFGPVVGRDEEISRMIQVLARQSKPNPLLVGDSGVGKTSIVEGVAQRIVNGDVPENLAKSRLFSLDLTALTAGARWHTGDFEARIKDILNDIVKSEKMFILFIDEIDVFMVSDIGNAAEVLKPMLSEGAFQCIGATTFAGYRELISEDGALERRFQKIDVPALTVPETITVLRSLQPRFEIHHGLRILDSAVVSAARLAARYLTYRNLPDSAIDLIDETAATITAQRNSKPEDLNSLERELHLLTVEINALKRDKYVDSESNDGLEEAKRKKTELEERLIPLQEPFEQERKSIDELIALKKKSNDLATKAHNAERENYVTSVDDSRYLEMSEMVEQIQELEVKVAEGKTTSQMSNIILDADAVADTTAKITGVPVAKLNQSDNKNLIDMEKVLASEVVGQSEAVSAVANAVRLTQSGLANPDQPASFLFLGLSGSGKTQLAKKVAGFLFDDEKAMIRIDCSELGDRWSTSKLIGAAPGYVGYHEGGILTEAVLKKPYSVVLFDEVEKASPEVLNVLLQVLDDGRITSSQGKLIDCSNTIIIMTSNLGAELINKSKGTEVDVKTKALVMEAVRRHFRPEFLNRISSMVVFNRLSKRAIAQIVRIRLKELQCRVSENCKAVTLEVDDAALEYLSNNGWSPDLGARPLNRLIQREISNRLAILLLTGQIRAREVARVTCSETGLEVIANHEAGENEANSAS